MILCQKLRVRLFLNLVNRIDPTFFWSLRFHINLLSYRNCLKKSYYKESFWLESYCNNKIISIKSNKSISIVWIDRMFQSNRSKHRFTTLIVLILLVPPCVWLCLLFFSWSFRSLVAAPGLDAPGVECRLENLWNSKLICSSKFVGRISHYRKSKTPNNKSLIQSELNRIPLI